jgi:hypothetical protein
MLFSTIKLFLSMGSRFSFALPMMRALPATAKLIALMLKIHRMNPSTTANLSAYRAPRTTRIG